MKDQPGEQLQEEPQSERGAPGSRDTGSDELSGGPVDRPAGTSEARDHTSVKPDDPIDDESPTMPAGDGGG
jgi:hypothetical protein